MIAYKFLGAGGVGLFSGFAWPVPAGGAPGPWVEAGGPLEPCRTGIHACRRGHLLDWMDDELWTVELAGPLLEIEAAVVGTRGRLVERVAGWTADAARDLGVAIVWRAASIASRALARAGRPELGERLCAAPDLDAMRQRAAEAAAVPAAREAAAFAADAVALLAGARPDGTDVARLAPPTPAALAANVAHVVAHAAGREAGAAGLPGGFGAGRAAERAWQLARLERVLGLPAGVADPG